jgi:hypothetical protein
MPWSFGTEEICDISTVDKGDKGIVYSGFVPMLGGIPLYNAKAG